MMRRLFLFFLLSISLFSLGLWRLSDGFSVEKITDPLPFNARWEITAPCPFQIRSILSQPFTYIGKGSQCYVFESQDHEYVLKFFRLNRYRLPSFQTSLPLPPFLKEIQQKKIDKKKNKKHELFASCKLAYDELKQESGLIYLHLNKTTHLAQEVTLLDNLKRPKTILIDHYAFVIQRKAEQLYPYLNHLIQTQQTEEIKYALISLSELISSRFKKEITDKDAEIHKNSGFYQGKAIFLDIGQFYKKQTNEDRNKVVSKLLSWLDEKDAELMDEIKPALILSTSD